MVEVGRRREWAKVALQQVVPGRSAAGNRGLAVLLRHQDVVRAAHRLELGCAVLRPDERAAPQASGDDVVARVESMDRVITEGVVAALKEAAAGAAGNGRRGGGGFDRVAPGVALEVEAAACPANLQLARPMCGDVHCVERDEAVGAQGREKLDVAVRTVEIDTVAAADRDRVGAAGDDDLVVRGRRPKRPDLLGASQEQGVPGAVGHLDGVGPPNRQYDDVASGAEVFILCRAMQQRESASLRLALRSRGFAHDEILQATPLVCEQQQRNAIWKCDGRNLPKFRLPFHAVILC